MRKNHKAELDRILKVADPIEVAYAAINAAVLDSGWEPRPRPATGCMLQLLIGMALGLNEKHFPGREVLTIIVADEAKGRADAEIADILDQIYSLLEGRNMHAGFLVCSVLVARMVLALADDNVDAERGVEAFVCRVLDAMKDPNNTPWPTGTAH